MGLFTYSAFTPSTVNRRRRVADWAHPISTYTLVLGHGHQPFMAIPISTNASISWLLISGGDTRQRLGHY